jgi:hypothetical protein
MSVNQNVIGTLWQGTIAGNSTAGPASFAAAINGGLTASVMPGPTSPVLGTAVGCPATDQRGRPRSPTTCTPGAVEP